MSADRTTARGLGLAASVPQQTIEAAAGAVAAGGFHSFWLNNPPNGGAIPTLGRLAPAVPNLWLGVGVVPLSHQSGAEIAAEVLAANIPLDRFYLGIGSGQGKGVDAVSRGVHDLKSELQTSVVVAALGPRMCRLSGREADGVLLNWLTPDWARQSVEWIADAAEKDGRAMPRLMAYVRVALGEKAGARLREEAGRYESFPAYAAHFARMGVSAANASIFGDTSAALQDALSDWDGVVDELVIRAIGSEDTPEATTELVEAVRPG